MKYAGAFGAALALLAASAFAASVTRTEANNGNLVMEDVPPIPMDIVDQMSELGVFGLTIPEEYGGLGMGMLAIEDDLRVSA